MKQGICNRAGRAISVATVSFLAALSLWATGLTVQAQGTPGGLLDGKVFAGEIGDKGKPASGKEDMSFKDGKMVSSACVSLGFASFPYKAVKKGDAIEFEGSASNPKEGTMAWKGSITGDTLTATAVWTRPGQAPDESWVKAKLKK